MERPTIQATSSATKPMRAIMALLKAARLPALLH
jgi:hypothetical protein